MFQEIEKSPIASEPISVVLPARNSGATLKHAAAEWKKQLGKRQTDFELIVVDDSSEDDESLAILAELEAEADGITVLRHETRLGIGACLRSGFAKVQYPLVCYCPAEGRYKPSEINRFLESIDNVDIVAGYRDRQKPPAWMKVMGGLFRGIVRAAFGIPLEPAPSRLGWSGASKRWFVRWTFGVFIHDADCAFRLFRREILDRLVIQSNGAFVHSEIIAKANFLGALIAQVPVSFKHETAMKETDWNKPAWKEIRRVLKNPIFTTPPPESESDEEPSGVNE